MIFANDLNDFGQVSLNNSLRKEIDALDAFCSYGLKGCKWSGVVLELSVWFENSSFRHRLHVLISKSFFHEGIFVSIIKNLIEV